MAARARGGQGPIRPAVAIQRWFTADRSWCPRSHSPARRDGAAGAWSSVDWKGLMSRRLAATFVALALAAPFTAAAQGYQPHGQEREGGNAGERGGGFGDRTGFGGDHGGRRGDWPVQEGEGPRGRYRPPDIDRVPREPVPMVSRLPRNNARMPGRQVWSRGQFLPPEVRGAMIEDFERYHLRRPPRGYYWYRAGDDYVLAATGTGVIFEVIQGDDY